MSETLKPAASITPASRPKNGTETLAVVCKLPHGLQIQLYRPAEKPDGVALPVGDPVVLAGANTHPLVSIPGAYGVTPGVDAAMFRAWMDANKDFPAVRNGLIFAEASVEIATDRARAEMANVSGLDPIDPKKPLGPNLEPLKP